MCERRTGTCSFDDYQVMMREPSDCSSMVTRRAFSGKELLKELATKLTTDFGKGFDESNLRYMRLFYRCFPKRDTLRHELTWSYYRRLISVENEAARLLYMNEAADSVWSTRQMDRQISTLYKFLRSVVRKSFPCFCYHCYH